MLAKTIFLLATLASTQGLINSTFDISVPGQDLEKHIHEGGISPELLRKIYSYTKNTKAFKNFTFEETADYMNNLFAWEAPDEISENFPYSLWGYDYERRPVWYQETGKHDFRRIVEEGKFPQLEKFYLRCLIHVVQSLQAVDLPGDEIRQGVFIWDMDKFDMKQAGHLPTVAALVGLAKKYGDIPLELVGRVFLVNANYVTKLAYDIARPLLGRLLENVEVYGSNRRQWLPRLLKTVPWDIIPPWYGGKEDFKPLTVYG